MAEGLPDLGVSCGACEGCTLVAALNAGERLIAESPNHANREMSRGGIAMTRKALLALNDELPCPGPSETNGQSDCPHREAAYQARGFGYNVWPQNQFLVPLEGQAVVERASEIVHNTGQYL
jgi:hypothetical protein